MSDKDLTMKAFLTDKRVFADVFNYYVYKGRKVIDADKLVELDPQEIMFPDEANGAEKAVEKRRDVLKECSAVMSDGERIYCILGVENQTYINYQGPFTVLGYDYYRINRQIAEIQEAHEKAKDLHGDELLSRFAKNDKIIPVFTLTILFSGKIWDGPIYLREMYAGKFDEAMENMMPDYKMNIIVPAWIKDESFGLFDTDLGKVLQFSKHSENKKSMKAFLEGKTLEDIDVKAARVINAIGNFGLVITQRAGRMNMCRAVEELKQDWKSEAREQGLSEGRAEGRVEGRSEGIAEGRAEGLVQGALNSLLSNVKIVMQKMNMSSADAMDFLEISNEQRDELAKML